MNWNLHAVETDSSDLPQTPFEIKIDPNNLITVEDLEIEPGVFYDGTVIKADILEENVKIIYLEHGRGTKTYT